AAAGLASAGLDAGALLALETVAPAAGARPAACVVAANAPAYIIYTSGSTGRPKGVLVTHDNVLRLFAATPVCVAAGPEDRWTLFHSFAFDFSVWEIWGPWLSGGQCVIVPLEVARDPAALVELVREHEITVLSQTPSAFGLFAAAERRLAQPLSTLRYLVFGGEALTLAALEGWVERHGDCAPQLINMYGITETTVHVTWRRIVAQDLAAGRGSVIGGALPHLSMTLMDGDGRPVPDGVAGEIWVGGAGVSAGYLNQPALTAERFVPDAFASRPGQRAYRSGDLARRGADGETDYLGRIDQQVKLRGHRIELGEIEQALLSLPEIGAACVGTYRKEPHGDPSLLGLCAWVVPRTSAAPAPAPAPETLRAALAARLPAYMLPDALVLVERIALTINGKADRSALPDPVLGRDAAAPAAPPRDQREQLLCQAMAQALGLDAVGIDDNYFALGGDSIRSLRFASTAQELGVPFPLRSLFEAPSVRALAATLAAASSGQSDATAAAPARAPFDGLEAAERAALPADAIDAFPLSRLQAGMLYHADFGDDEGLYLDLVSNRLDRQLERAAFERAVSVLEARHPALRTSFHLSGARALQVVHAGSALRVDWCDLRDFSPALACARVARQDEALRRQPYVPEQPGLLRLRVSALADGSCWLSVAIHHAILDGWSVALLSAELLALYGAACGGTLQAGAPAACEMADFVAREQKLMQAPEAGDFWRSRLAALPVSQLPRWGEAGAERPRQTLALAPDSGAQLAALCAASGLPAKAWLLGLVAQVLGWNAGEAAFTVGLVVNGRAQSAGGAAALGLFLNTIPLALPARGSWRALAGAALRADAETYDWRNYPLAEMVRLHDGRKPFEVNLNFVHFRPLAGVQRSSGIGVLESLSSESTELPLTINFGIDPDSGALSGQLVANASFSAVQVAALAAQLACGLGRLLQAPDAPADCASEAERDWSLRRFNRSAAAPAFTPLPLRVLRRLRAAPSATALVDADGTAWQGAELLDRVERLAALLLQSGLREQQAVAVYQGRSLDAVASQIAIAALGGWYVPLDTEAPQQRIAAILDDLGAPLLLADRPLDAALAQRCTPLQVAAADACQAGDGAAAVLEQRAARLAPLAAAYAIYTSGSSGVPKGVQIGHAAWANHMAWMGARFEFGPRDRILHRTRASFDASVWEIWAPLDSGAVLVLASAEASADPGALLRTIERQRISVAQVVPSLLEALPGDPDEAALERLRLLFAGGEVLRRQAALAIIGGRRLQLVNLYGPTETTIDATFEVVDAGHALRSDSGVIPIGLPIDGVSAVVVDQDLQPLPVGATGELLLGGAAVGLAYLGQPALTAERFVPDPYGAPGSRAFLTRDLVRRLADGRLDFVGRLDRQVKIGGNRIELGEIEVALAQLTGGRRCAIETETPPGGTPRLVAYVECGGEGDAAGPAQWRAALARQLPGYMVPALVRLVDRWPLMASGKTDRAALAASASAALAMPATPLPAPHDDGAVAGGLQALLANEVATLLGLSTVGLDDDFFSIGGDSISAMQLVARARRLGVTLSAGAIFKLRSVRQMARGAAPALPASMPALAVPATAAARWPLLPIQHWYFGLRLANPHWYHQTVALRPRARYRLEQVEAALRDLGQRHDAFGARFSADASDTARGDGAPLLRRCDSDDPGQLCLAAAALQAAARLDRGPLWGAVLASGDGVTLDALVVAVHHIAVDGVSWRILLDELGLLLAGAALPAPATALAEAALQLEQWQPQPAERRHWEALLETLGQGRDAAAAPAGLQGDSVSAACALTQEETAQLLARAGDHWNASVEELLLAALMLAGAGMPLRQDALVLVEGHGRDVVAGVDLGRTVGWFTTQRPLLLPAAPDSPQEAVRQAKLRLRALPAAGGGWLRLCRERSVVALDDAIVFNYLGRFDGTIGAGEAPFEALEITLPPASDPANRRSSLLDLVAVIEGQCLRLGVEADGSRVGAARAGQLAQQLKAALLGLARPDRLPASLAWLASDFPLAGLAGESELRALLASYPATRQLLPCTPVQQGMVFDQQLHANAGGHYIQQLEIALAAAPDAVRLEQAFQQLVARHDTLRAAFVHGEGARPLQLVQAQLVLPFAVLDLCGQADPGAAWRTLLAEDRARGFVLAEAPLARATLARLGPQEWRLLWSHHHLLADGWSQPVLLGELVALYHQAPLPPPVAVPASYWRWLDEVDETALRQRWQRRFAGFEAATLVASGTLAAPPAAPLVLALDAPDSARLQQFCRTHGLTLAAVIQAAWALMLGKMLHVDDVAFGMVVSGRPAGIAGSADWVGMFINTLPVRVGLAGSAELLPWLAEIHQEMAEIADSAHLPLPRIQSWVNQGRPLFDSIVVFENYPLQSLAPQHGEALALAGVTAHEVNEYPLSLYVEPGASLSLSLRHDPGRFATRCALAMGEGVLEALRAWSGGAVRQLGATPVLAASARLLAQRVGCGPQLAQPAPDVIEAIRRQAAHTPHALALEDGGDARYSYAALLEQAQRLAGALAGRGIA
ncbi:non-ribosomal peptide synthetase, partial [Janthinobacterium sp. PC23-8]|uniref:non-ribosomal peptide synthetase n=1 Tax=Janthinobacterium sp. PC23-8 TaxID=2012679 RepID=UPI001595C691